MFDDRCTTSFLFLMFVWCPCMAINVSVQYNGGLLFGGTLVIGLITEPLGFVQDAQDVMVLFDEWLSRLGAL